MTKGAAEEPQRLSKGQYAAAIVAAVVVSIGGWIAAVSINNPDPYPECPADVADYTGACAVGDDLYRYEDGQVCARGRFVNGDSNWLDLGICL
jgi:hypothetical protein